MSGNMHSFCANPVSGLLVLYMLCLGVFVFVWVSLGMLMNLSTNSTGLGAAFKSASFSKLELKLMGLSSFFIGILVTLNLIVLRSQVPTYYFSYSESPIKSCINIMARQWYWVFNLIDDIEEEIESYMSRLIDCVDNSLYLSLGSLYTLNMTSADVLHAFSLPCAEMKVDAVPGRIHQLYLFANVPGRFVGYCSEFCGAGHSFMPMVVNMV